MRLVDELAASLLAMARTSARSLPNLFTPVSTRHCSAVGRLSKACWRLCNGTLLLMKMARLRMDLWPFCSHKNTGVSKGMFMSFSHLWYTQMCCSFPSTRRYGRRAQPETSGWLHLADGCFFLDQYESRNSMKLKWLLLLVGMSLMLCIF